MCDFWFTIHNITKQLNKQAESLWHVNNYIEDAAREANEEYVKVFKEIKTGKDRHAKTLRDESKWN